MTMGAAITGASYTSADGGVTVTVIEGKDPLGNFQWWIVGAVAGAVLGAILLALLAWKMPRGRVRRRRRP